ncbi:LOW QUALITY PROTEIN: Hypothetical protein PHPALM_11799 [Phytophthora palmivora]|uniref:HAT C-terminal dimerisation domain-containing protein n=1 Tax=Phytophthora palmivora TaxID=4796 RepID=A0A2P4Y1B8_9STRA|nr:LOW QUALITY PROTEIN: Hypothetical protein PHPALM_11799 [Phytophthora palmivora]
MLMQSVRYLYLKLVLERLIDKLPVETFWISQLDPRAALMKHLGAVEREYSSECFISAAIEMAKGHGVSKQQPKTPPPKVQKNTRRAHARQTYFAATQMKSQLQKPIQRCECESERPLYLADACQTSLTTDPLVWWEGKEMRYPILASLVRKWLGCIATSVPSERAFSTSGNLVTLKRYSLAPNIIRDTLFVGQNYEEGDGSDMITMLVQDNCITIEDQVLV